VNVECRSMTFPKLHMQVHGAGIYPTPSIGRNEQLLNKSNRVSAGLTCGEAPSSFKNAASFAVETEIHHDTQCIRYRGYP
jgi:hypothetical protein